jgi:cell division protein FtsI/penicillin-binding protein 2
LSVLGAAELAYAVAERGRVMDLHIVKEAPGYEAPHHATVAGRAMRESTAWELTKMMEGTVNGGTSYAVFSAPDGRNYLGSVRVAGKTGTLRRGDGPTTSWFVGFAPSRAPRIVVAVLLQNGAIWRRKANEVGRDLLRSYFAARGARGVTPPESTTATASAESERQSEDRRARTAGP